MKEEKYFYYSIITPVILFVAGVVPFIALNLLFKGSVGNEVYPVAFILMLVPVFVCYRAYKTITAYFHDIPALTLTADEIIDHQNNVAIEWEDVEKIEMTNQKGSYIKIFTNDPDKNIGQKNGPYWLLLKINTFIDGATAKISLSALQGDNDEIFREVIEFKSNLDLYKNKKRVHL